MDPNVTLECALEDLDTGHRDDARIHAEYLYEWLLKGGFYPADRDGCDRLLTEFGYDPNPTRIF